MNDSDREILKSDDKASFDEEGYLKHNEPDLSFVDGVLNSPSWDSNTYLAWWELRRYLTFWLSLLSIQNILLDL